MKSKASWIASQACVDSLEWEEDKPRITREYDYPFAIVEISETVRQVACSNEVVFRLIQVPGGARVAYGQMGARLLGALGHDYERIAAAYDRHVLCPYYSLFVKLFTEFGCRASELTPKTCARFNVWVNKLRYAARDAGFSRIVENQKRSTRKNAKSILEGIRALHETHSRLCVVRMDLSRSKAYRASLRPGDVDPHLLKRHFAMLVRYLHRQFPSFLWFAARLEYAPLKSYHIHAVLIFNGHDVSDDIGIGELVGAQWEKITADEGNHFNCNRHKHVYQQSGVLGIGMVNYHDADLRSNMERAALYLTKADFYAKLNVPRIKRTFFRSTMKREKPSRRGRPRTRVALSKAPA